MVSGYLVILFLKEQIEVINDIHCWFRDNLKFKAGLCGSLSNQIDMINSII
jgi:hypothetical protein